MATNGNRSAARAADVQGAYCDYQAAVRLADQLRGAEFGSARAVEAEVATVAAYDHYAATWHAACDAEAAAEIDGEMEAGI
jgi:hypothetical protein